MRIRSERHARAITRYLEFVLVYTEAYMHALLPMSEQTCKGGTKVGCITELETVVALNFQVL
jgi:hypothetical protein